MILALAVREQLPYRRASSFAVPPCLASRGSWPRFGLMSSHKRRQVQEDSSRPRPTPPPRLESLPLYRPQIQ
jgi:hypothetical protein